MAQLSIILAAYRLAIIQLPNRTIVLRSSHRYHQTNYNRTPAAGSVLRESAGDGAAMCRVYVADRNQCGRNSLL